MFAKRHKPFLPAAACSTRQQEMAKDRAEPTLELHDKERDLLWTVLVLLVF